MKSKLELINDLKLEKILILEDYIQLIFFDKAILNIYNNYRASEKLVNFKDLHINSIEEKDDYIKINFEKNMNIFIDMRDEAYCGPEALELIMQDGKIIVWN